MSEGATPTAGDTSVTVKEAGIQLEGLMSDRSTDNEPPKEEEQQRQVEMAQETESGETDIPEDAEEVIEEQPTHRIKVKGVDGMNFYRVINGCLITLVKPLRLQKRLKLSMRKNDSITLA